MPETLKFLLNHLETPIGEMLIATDTDGNLRAIDWADYGPRMHKLLRRYYGEHGFTFEETSIPSAITRAMSRYFSRDLSALDALPVKLEGTPFQLEVWKALQKIPCGKTLSYSELAAQIGRPSAVRAVGLANGSNPVGVVVPCHRVIGSNGSLTGYGGGLHRKSWLLQHESSAGTKGSPQDTLF